MPPPRRLDTLLIGTWNLREFDSDTWGARVPESYAYIAEIVDRFDLVAVQEVRLDLRALERLIVRLGPHWRYLVSDVTGAGRATASGWRSSTTPARSSFLGMAGELVLPPLEKDGAECRPAGRAHAADGRIPGRLDEVRPRHRAHPLRARTAREPQGARGGDPPGRALPEGPRRGPGGADPQLHRARGLQHLH